MESQSNTLDPYVIQAIKLAQEVTSEYLLYYNRPVIPVVPPPNSELESIPAYIARQKGYELHLQRVRSTAIIEAYIKRYDNSKPEKVEIVFSSRLNQCWSRFLICKEISHLLLGHKGNYTCNRDQIEGLITQLLLPDPPVLAADEALLVEHTAFCSAIELLIPSERRYELYAFIDSAMDRMEIAEFYRVPRVIVDFLATERARSYFDETPRILSLANINE